MGELNEKLWAVLSERGCEESGLTYVQAGELLRHLKLEKVSGLCIITAPAADRVSLTENRSRLQSQSNGTKPPLARRRSS